jgi:hypothetical protein
MSYAFLFRAQPDVDHMSPLAWRLLSDGDEVHALVAPGYDPGTDPRLAFLATHPRFHLHAPWRAGRRLRRLRAALPYAFSFLRRHRVRVLVVEWGHGPRIDGSEGKLRMAVELSRRFAASLLAAPRPDAGQVRSNMIFAATARGLPVACIPHGVSVKLEGRTVHGPQARRFEREGTIDWSDRNRFAVYVYDSEHHRRWHLEHALGDPEVLEAWGSLRWSPQWFRQSLGLYAPFEWPAEPGRVRVLLMAPKWRKRVDVEAAIGLVERIQGLEFVTLAVKGHPRKTGSLEPLRQAAGIDWSRIRDVSAADSVPLIAAADVVIDVGSSIGIEVVLQGKVLLNPAFLHELTTVFDVLDGSCVRASDADEAIAYLRAHAEGRRHRVDDAVLAELERLCIYAEEPRPFDVPGRYAERIRALAAAG